MFRLVGGMHPPYPPPPKSATVHGYDCWNLVTILMRYGTVEQKLAFLCFLI